MLKKASRATRLPFLGVLLFPKSGRARLLAAFVILFVSSMGLGMVGWGGLGNTERALRAFDEQVLPDIARSLELAERAANLAALAPYVAEASVPFQLQAESDALRARMQEVLRLAADIPQLDAAAPGLSSLLGRLEETSGELIELTRQDLFLREDLRQHLYRLSQFREHPEIRAAGRPAQAAAIADVLIASATTHREDLIYFRARYDRLLAQSVTDQALPAAALETLRITGIGDGSIFELRSRQLALAERRAFLLASTRAISRQLSLEVNRFVSTLQGRVNRQSGAVSATVRSGQAGIMVITLVCVLAAGLGALLVRRMMNSLKAVTQLMTRLAEGDTQQATPATDREDEVGALARAFHVFRENAVARKLLTADLTEQKRLLETVFSNIHDGLSVFDRDGRLVTWNPQYIQLLELPESAICRGMSLEEVRALLPVSRETHVYSGNPIDPAQLDGARQRVAQTLERHYGDGKVVEFRSRPMPDGGFVTLYSDLTDRRAVEAQLRQSQKMEVLGQLTGGVAHDFNNLLGATMGNLQLLIETEHLPERLLRYARRALAAAERGAGLTRRLLAFARRQQLSPETLRVDALVEELVELVEYSVGTAISIELDLKAEERCVHVDRAQLENALLNLAINSSSAMPQGGKLRFATRAVAHPKLSGEPEGGVLIEVTDTGCGIPAGQLERVLEPFFTTKKVGEGSGLGLSIVYGFVKQSGGEVHIASEVGAGTTVSILLPAWEPSEGEECPPQAPSVVSRAVPARRLLLVEDDVQVREAVSDMLRALGHEVFEASSVVSALDRLAQDSSLQTVISDVDLGRGGDGVSLHRVLAERQPQLQVVLTSGLPREQLVARFGLEDDVLVLQKPCRMEELAAALAR